MIVVYFLLVYPFFEMYLHIKYRGYPKDFIEAEMEKVKFTPKSRNNKRNKSLKAVPFVMTYHPKLKSMNKVFLKYLDLLYLDKEVKRVFTPKPMISFRRARKLISYLVRAKRYPTERTVGSYKCGGKRCEFCINVSETSTFPNTVTGETCSKCKMQYVGRLLTSFGQDGTVTKVTLESMVRELHLCNNICLIIFVPLAIAAP